MLKQKPEKCYVQREIYPGGPTYQSSIAGFTDQSDSDLSAFEIPTINEADYMTRRPHADTNAMDSNTPQLMISPNHSLLSIPRHHQEGIDRVKLLKIDQINRSAPPLNYHPFAEKPSPFEEWKQTAFLLFETMFQFFLHDICGNSLYYSWKMFEYVILTPAAIIGLIFEFFRKLMQKAFYNL